MVKTFPFRNLQVPQPGFDAMGLCFSLRSNLTLEEAEPVKRPSPLGRGWLVDDIPYNTTDDLAPDNGRRNVPKWQGGNFYKNKAIIEDVRKLAKTKACALPQIALAWMTSQGMIAIPGTTKPGRLEDKWTSRDVELTDEEKREMRRSVDDAKPSENRYLPAHEALSGH